MSPPRPTRLLLDTHVFVWWRMAPERLSDAAKSVIAHAELAYVSIASAWEIAIKTSLGKISLPASVRVGVEASGFTWLSILPEHVEEVAGLEWHHRDPFDRMLVAQARHEALTLVSSDRAVACYDVDRLDA